MPLPVILDTDIGTDVDDLFALALIMASPELDLVGVITVHADVDFRAAMVLKFLETAGRPDIPVVTGYSRPLNPSRPLVWAGYEGHGIDYSEVNLSSIGSRDPLSFILSCLEKTPDVPPAIISIGPLTNTGAFCRDHPHAARALPAISLMGGNYMGLGARPILAEHNFKLDPEAADYVMHSGASVRAIGLNITRQTSLTRQQCHELIALETPMGRLLGQSGLHYMGCVGRDSTPMHDSTAVAAASQPDLFTWVKARARVQTAGKEFGVVYYNGDIHPGDATVQVAKEFQLFRFQNLFWQRIFSLAEQKQ